MIPNISQEVGVRGAAPPGRSVVMTQLGKVGRSLVMDGFVRDFIMNALGCCGQGSGCR